MWIEEGKNDWPESKKKDGEECEQAIIECLCATPAPAREQAKNESMGQRPLRIAPK